MKGKIALFSVALLSIALLALSTFSTPVVAATTITIDGDPSDWTGTPGGTNTFVASGGEGIWKDAAFDDTGNGSYIYPNQTHNDPDPAFNDSAGAPWQPYNTRHVFAYTDKFGGFRPDDPWYQHGGMCDLAELRITADASALYIMARIENMCNFANAVEWNYWCHNTTVGWDANATGYGKVVIQVFIDTDQVYGSGSTSAPMLGNFLIDPSAAWEHVVNIAGDNRRFSYANWPKYNPYSDPYNWGMPWVNHTDGTSTLLNQSSGPGTPTIYTQGDADIYPACIEMKVPYSALQGDDARGATWRFTVVVGGLDEGSYRQVWNLTLAQGMGWPTWFQFTGGEGGPAWMGNLGNDPNIIDMAFTPDQATQEAILNNFTKMPGSGLAVIKAYQDITFSSNGLVGGEVSALNTLLLMAPYIILGVAVAATAVSVVIYGRKHAVKTL